jgi:hypothetical protein
MRLISPCFPVVPAKTLPLAAALFCLAFTSSAAPTQTNTPAKSSAPPPAATNAAPAQPEIPQSVFIIPTTPQEGKDPFYPRSMRLFTSVTVTATNQPTVIAVELQLKALSGPPDHRLAIINNHTFDAGEEGEVATNAGRVRIICLEIKDDSVVVLVGGERRILRLRPGI